MSCSFFFIFKTLIVATLKSTYFIHVFNNDSQIARRLIVLLALNVRKLFKRGVLSCCKIRIIGMLSCKTV